MQTPHSRSQKICWFLTFFHPLLGAKFSSTIHLLRLQVLPFRTLVKKSKEASIGGGGVANNRNRGLSGAKVYEVKGGDLKDFLKLRDVLLPDVDVHVSVPPDEHAVVPDGGQKTP